MRRSYKITYPMPDVASLTWLLQHGSDVPISEPMTIVQAPMDGGFIVQDGGLLDPLTRSRLNALGVTHIRRSLYRTARECPHEAYLMGGGRAEEVYTAYPLLGSVFHVALSRAITSSTGNTWNAAEWLDCFAAVRAAYPGQRYVHNGVDVDIGMVKGFIREFLSGDSIGVPVGYLVDRCVSELQSKSYTNLVAETRLSLDLGGGQVSATGTRDLFGTFHDYSVLLDCKTSGLWGVLLKDDGQIAKQSASAEDLMFHDQLLFYAWLHYRSTERTTGVGEVVQFFALLFPTNAVPYKTGKDQGKERGALIQASPTTGLAQLQDYERDFVQFWTAWAAPGGRYRARPTNFGKCVCPRCPVYKSCYKDSSATSDAGMLADKQFDYLRTP